MARLATTDQLDVWRDLIREHFVALDIAADRETSFAGRVRAADVGYLNVARVQSSAQTFTRTVALARADDDVYLQVGLVARGAGAVQQDGREATLQPGDFAVYESDRPFTWVMDGDWELLVFTWPRASVRLHDTATQALTARCVSGSDGAGAIVGRMLRDLAGAPPQLSLDGGIRFGTEVCDLVTTVAAEGVHRREPAPSAVALLDTIDDYIVEHLSDPNLGPRDIAAAHFISTRHLHRLFAARGTAVTQQIQHQRLERCRLDLRHTGHHGRSITDISRRWGFPDLATFSRAFRATYGMTPTQCRTGLVPTVSESERSGPRIC